MVYWLTVLLLLFMAAYYLGVAFCDLLAGSQSTQQAEREYFKAEQRKRKINE
jgi:hypothetical protein